MNLFKYVSFIGAGCLLAAIASSGYDTVGTVLRWVGCLVMVWGAVYFLLRENEILYGTVCVIFAVLVQPLYDLGYTPGIWMSLAFVSSVYLLLAGLLSIKIEKAHAAEHAKIEAELEVYRKNQEKLREQQAARGKR